MSSNNENTSNTSNEPQAPRSKGKGQSKSKDKENSGSGNKDQAKLAKKARIRRKLNRLQTLIATKFPQLSSKRVRELLSEAARRQYPKLEPSERLELLLQDDPKERRKIALKVVQALRCAAKSTTISDDIDVHALFNSQRPTPTSKTALFQCIAVPVDTLLSNNGVNSGVVCCMRLVCVCDK